MATIFVIASLSTNSGAGESMTVLRADTKPVKAAPEKCSAHKAIRYYQAQYAAWRAKMRVFAIALTRPTAKCPRYMAKVWRAKAHGAKAAYGRWVEYHYHWWKWLPDKFRRVGHCETGGTSGATAAGNWSWDSGTYVSAFGIIRAAFPTWNGHNTPREQYEVAASIQQRYGWGAWGCGGA